MVRLTVLIFLLLILPVQAKPHPPPPPPPEPPHPPHQANLDVSICPSDLKAGKMNILRITLKNMGDLPVRDLKIRIKSDLPIDSYKEIREIEPNSNVSIEVPVVPKRCGTFTIEISLESPDYSYAVEKTIFVKRFADISIDLRSDVTKAIVGEEFSLTLSVVNLINNPNMTLQVILIPPSGMSVTSAYFTKSGVGQFVGVFKVNPGEMRAIKISVLPNEPGNFTIRGIIVYYFGNDKRNATSREISIPIVVKSKEIPRSPGFEWIGIVPIILLGLRRWGQ